MIMSNMRARYGRSALAEQMANMHAARERQTRVQTICQQISLNWTFDCPLGNCNGWGELGCTWTSIESMDCTCGTAAASTASNYRCCDSFCWCCRTTAAANDWCCWCLREREVSSASSPAGIGNGANTSCSSSWRTKPRNSATPRAKTCRMRRNHDVASVGALTRNDSFDGDFNETNSFDNVDFALLLAANSSCNLPGCSESSWKDLLICVDRKISFACSTITMNAFMTFGRLQKSAVICFYVWRWFMALGHINEAWADIPREESAFIVVQESRQRLFGQIAVGRQNDLWCARSTQRALCANSHTHKRRAPTIPEH